MKWELLQRELELFSLKRVLGLLAVNTILLADLGFCLWAHKASPTAYVVVGWYVFALNILLAVGWYCTNRPST